MKRVLFTGLNGFVGRNFLSCINTDSLDILRLPYGKPGVTGKDTNYKYQFSVSDLIEQNINNIDVLVHLGASTPKTAAQMNDMESNIKNITNTAHLFQNLPNIPKRVIYISTISVYDEKNIDLIDETSNTVPGSLYGMSKLFSEKIIEQYCFENNVEYQILRLGVVYGNNKEYQGLIPTFINQVSESKPITIFDGGKAKRQFINVEDVCHYIYEAIVQERILNPIVNVVGEEVITVKEIADVLIGIEQKNIEIIDKPTNNAKNDVLFDVSILKNTFKHKQIPIKNGLKKVYTAIRGAE